MRKLVLSTFALLAFTQVQAQCTELFFSEYLEGSSNNKALEIYNPTSSTVNLSNYKVYRSNNGSPIWQDSLQLVGTLAPGAVYVMGNPSADPAILGVSDTLHTITFFNGDDALMLKNVSTNTELDYIGILGVDPGVNWVVGTGFTSENTLVRMASVQGGTTNWAVSATQWDVNPQNTFSFLGSHTMTPCAGPVPTLSFTVAADTVLETVGMAFAEVSITNPNGNATTVDVVVTGGTATGGGTDYLLAVTSLTFPANSSLPQSATLNIVDDLLLEGMETIVFSMTNATNGASVSGNTSFTLHIEDNEVPALPVINLASLTAVVGENAGTVQITMNIAASNASPTTVDLEVFPTSTMTNPADYSGYTFPHTVTFPANSNSPVSLILNITDDAITESTETLELRLRNITNGTLGADTVYTLTVTDNDVPYYPIATVHTEDAVGAADSVGTYCQLTGTVYGVNLRPTGLQFTIRDYSGGIAVFKSGPVSAYTVTEGDSIRIYGLINQFNGLTQMAPDSIFLISQGAALKTPTLVSAAFTEAIESDLIRINGVSLVTPAQWTNTGSGFNVDISDGATTWVMRIDADVNLYGQPAPTGMFDVIGIGSQFDNSSPYDAGYQLMPRYIPDLMPLAAPVVNLGADTTLCTGDSLLLDAGNPGMQYAWSTGATTQTIWATAQGTYTVTVTDPGNGQSSTDAIQVTLSPLPTGVWSSVDFLLTVDFTAGIANATSWTWDFGDGAVSNLENPTHTYAADGVYTVCLTASNGCGDSTWCDTLSVIGSSVQDPGLASVEIYPNPSQGAFSLKAQVNGPVHIEILNALGQTVLRRDADAAGSFETRLDLSSLSRGVYYLNLRTQAGQVSRRLVLE